MTTNDKLILANFRTAKLVYDFLAGDFDADKYPSTFETLRRQHIARVFEIPEIIDKFAHAYQELIYLDDTTLRAQANIALFNYGAPDTWPDSKTVMQSAREAEEKLLEAANQNECNLPLAACQLIFR